jgi:hypothetical protein
LLICHLPFDLILIFHIFQMFCGLSFDLPCIVLHVLMRKMCTHKLFDDRFHRCLLGPFVLESNLTLPFPDFLSGWYVYWGVKGSSYYFTRAYHSL